MRRCLGLHVSVTAGLDGTRSYGRYSRLAERHLRSQKVSIHRGALFVLVILLFPRTTLVQVMDYLAAYVYEGAKVRACVRPMAAVLLVAAGVLARD